VGPGAVQLHLEVLNKGRVSEACRGQVVSLDLNCLPSNLLRTSAQYLMSLSHGPPDCHAERKKQGWQEVFGRQPCAV
jgi:hypothetical protein